MIWIEWWCRFFGCVSMLIMWCVLIFFSGMCMMLWLLVLWEVNCGSMFSMLLVVMMVEIVL